MEKYGRAKYTTDDNLILRRKDAGMQTHVHNIYNSVFTLQQCIRECVCVTFMFTLLVLFLHIDTQITHISQIKYLLQSAGYLVYWLLFPAVFLIIENTAYEHESNIVLDTGHITEGLNMLRVCDVMS